MSCIYELPLRLHAEGLDQQIVERLNIWSRDPDLGAWQRMVEKIQQPSRGAVKIGVVGKYVHLRDSYKSLHEALVHGGLANDVRVEIEYIDSEDLLGKDDWEQRLAEYDAILVPGGFGDRGIEGKIRAIRYAREREGAVLRHLPRHAARGGRVRAPRVRPGRARTRSRSIPRPSTRSST